MRAIVRWAAGLAAVAVLAAAAGTAALAGTAWCEVDPTVYVDGRQLVLTTMFDATYASSTSVVTFEVQVPSNTRAKVVHDPSPVPEKVTVSYVLPPASSTEPYLVVVKVTVVSADSFRTQTAVSGRNVDKAFTVEGKSNVVTTFKVKLNP